MLDMPLKILLSISFIKFACLMPLLKVLSVSITKLTC